MAKIKISSTNHHNKRVIVTTCPLTYTLHKIGGRWKPLILNQLFSGPKRYSELKKSIAAISEKMLIQNLKELEADALVVRKALPVVPPHVEYSLSEKSKELSPVFGAMKKWALKYNV